MYYYKLTEFKDKNDMCAANVAVTFGRRILLSGGSPVMMKDRKGILHRYIDGWDRVMGEHVEIFCGLNKEEFFNLPQERLPKFAIRAATAPMLWKCEYIAK